MSAGPNKIRAKLACRQLVTGTAIYSSSPNMVEAAGYSGIDFVRIDTEHAWRQDDSLDNMIRGANLAGACPIVRVDRENPYLIRKVLELGAGGVIVPHVYTAAYAREVVAASKFPPHGIRGFGNLCAAGNWGTIPADEWIAWSNKEPVIGIMIETPEALHEIDEILAVGGLDFVLFGPADYSIAIGLSSPQIAHPEVEDGLRRTIAAAKRHEKHVMLGVGFDDIQVGSYIGMGVTMLEFGHDVMIVQSTLSAKVARFGGGTISL